MPTVTHDMNDRTTLLLDSSGASVDVIEVLGSCDESVSEGLLGPIAIGDRLSKSQITRRCRDLYPFLHTRA
jgi:hypothetical protein